MKLLTKLRQNKKKALTSFVAMMLTITMMVSSPVLFSGTNIDDTTKITDYLKGGPQPKVKSLDRVTNLKVYRSTEAALVSWDKVENAKYYLVYRKNGKSGKYQKVGKVLENDFALSTYNLKVREFVDIRYKESKKKSSMDYKGRKYLYDKNYTYKVIAVNRKVKSRGATYYSKKWKMKKNELSYYTLYLVNKERKKEKECFYIWGHAYEKGSLKTSKWLSKRKNHIPRPKHTFKFYKYLDKKFISSITGTNAAVCLLTNGTVCTREICQNSEHSHPYFSPLGPQNVGIAYEGTTKDVFDAYVQSSGHYGPMLMANYNEIEYNTYLNGTSSKELYIIVDGLTKKMTPDESFIETYSLTSSTYSENILKEKDIYHELIIGEEDNILNEYKYR